MSSLRNNNNLWSLGKKVLQHQQQQQQIKWINKNLVVVTNLPICKLQQLFLINLLQMTIFNLQQADNKITTNCR